jgi:hypothetical protein
MRPTTLIFSFFQEDHLWRGRTVLRPVARFSLGVGQPVVSALIDTGSEHVLADTSLALIAGIDLDDPVDVEEVGIGGGFVRARFVAVTGSLHPPDGVEAEPLTWTLDIGFIASPTSHSSNLCSDFCCETC